MSSTFESYNQFDARFKELGNFGSDRNACPLFSLFTAYHFMKNGNVSEEKHEQNVEAAISNYITHPELPKYMSFDELIQYFSGVFVDSDIQATMPELINEYGVGSMFKEPDYNHNYALIILKNSNFISVLVKNVDGHMVYHLRDCHEQAQHNFQNFADLENHLKEKYQFGELTVVDGVLIEEFGNIEYLVVDEPFVIPELDPELFNGESDVGDVGDAGEMFDDYDDDSGIQIEIPPELLVVGDYLEPSQPSQSTSQPANSDDMSVDEAYAMQLMMEDLDG